MTRTGQSLNEVWRMNYRDNRYARHLTRPELNKRIRDIMLNLLRLTPEAKTGVFPVDQTSTGIWWEKWTHVLEEMQLRYGPFPAGFARDVLHSEPFPDFASELAGKAARRMAELNLRPGSVLIKLGDRQHMEELVGRGALLMRAASYYSRPELNQAVGDNELSLPMSLYLTREQLVKLVANPADVPVNAHGQRIDIEFASGEDFWLYCMTRSVEPRLFVDFNYHACVVIRQPAIFADRFRRAARLATNGAIARDGRAKYIDPLLPDSPKVFIPFSKPFGFAYQDEYRFCWMPKTATPRLEDIPIEMGTLSDIAELIVLDD